VFSREYFDHSHFQLYLVPCNLEVEDLQNASSISCDLNASLDRCFPRIDWENGAPRSTLREIADPAGPWRIMVVSAITGTMTGFAQRENRLSPAGCQLDDEIQLSSCRVRMLDVADILARRLGEKARLFGARISSVFRPTGPHPTHIDYAMLTARDYSTLLNDALITLRQRSDKR
jgi:hypothetical protein